MTPRELRRIRRTLGWTQMQMAARLGVGRLYVVRRETGARLIPRMMDIAVKCIAEHLRR